MASAQPSRVTVRGSSSKNGGGTSLTSKQRTDLAASMTARMLNANINPSFSGGPSKSGHGGGGAAAKIGSSTKLPRFTEASREFQYRGDEDMPVDKAMHLKNDAIKVYVEKALSLHDDRKGMPVVASPIWAPKVNAK